MKRLALVVSVVSILSSACGVEVQTYSSNSWSKQEKIGGACSDSSQCEGSALCARNFPGGYCFQDCSSASSVCPTGSACIEVDSRTAQCFAKCYGPGSQSTCRTGYTCLRVTGEIYGVCMPK